MSIPMLDRYMSMNNKEKLTSMHEVKALRKRGPVSMRTLKYRVGLELLASELTSMRNVIDVKA